MCGMLTRTTVTASKTCLVLMKDPARTRGIGWRSRSEILFEEVVRPAAEEHELQCARIDPADFATDSQQVFSLLESAPVVIMDASAGSMDFAYALGVRHALGDKPTLILAETEIGLDGSSRDEIYRWPDGRPRLAFDVPFQKGVLPIQNGVPNASALRHAREWLSKAIGAALMVNASRYSPVRAVLDKVPRVFLSYAHKDRESVMAVDQWLRDQDFRVDVDERDFIAGRDIRDEIVRCIQHAGKVVCFYSESSTDRYYTKLERRIVEEAEHEGASEKVMLIYFRLDASPLPIESSFRLAVNAWRLSFSDACEALLRHLLETPGAPSRISLDA